MFYRSRLFVAGVVLCALISAATPAIAQTDTTFTYQGELKDGGSLANGSFVMDFSLWDALAAGSQIGSTQNLGAVAVADGRFTVELDIGASSFPGGQQWLQIDVNATPLSPRQPITRAPYSIQTRGIFVSDAGNVGIGTGTPTVPLEVIGAGDGMGVRGEGFVGVLGEGSTWPLGAPTGVKGVSGAAAALGFGVWGVDKAGSSIVIYTSAGVYGESATSVGVLGHSDSGYGVRGESIGGYGVLGESASGYALRGESADGFAGYFLGDVKIVNDGGAPGDMGLLSQLTNATGGSSSVAVRGEHLSVTSSGIGVWGSQAGDGYGVFGNTPTGIGVFGHSYGTTSGTYNEGVRGQVDNVSGYGVRGIATATGGPATGVYGTAASSSGTGVWGWATAASGSATGVLGRSDSPTGTAVRGFTTATTGANYGVWGESASGFGYGVFATNTSSFGTAMLGQESAEGGIGVWGLSQATIGNGIGVMGGSLSAAGFDFWANGAGVDYGSSSSRRWKRNIETIDDPLYRLSKLRGVYYDWDEEHGGHHDIGMIAEEVGAVLPEIVRYEENGVDAIGMDYSKLTPLLVEAVNALRDENTRLLAEQEGRLASISDELAVARSENRDLREQLAALEAAVHALSIDPATPTGEEQP